MDWLEEKHRIDMNKSDGGMLDWIKENPTKAVATGLITPYAAKGALSSIARPFEQRASEKVSIKIDSFYSKGADKKKLAFQHFLGNERDEVNKIAKKWYPDLKNLSYLKKKEMLIRLAKEQGVTIRPDKALNRAPGNFGEFAAVLERKDILSTGVSAKDLSPQGKRIRALDLDIRSEHQWQVLNKVVNKDVGSLSHFDKAKLNNAGITAPTKTSMKEIYGGKHFGTGDLQDHSRGIGGHGRQMADLDTRVSHSKIISGGDRRRMWKAVSKDHMNQMAEYVMKHADLDNPDKLARVESIRKHAQQKYFSLAKTPKQWGSLHWEVGNADKSLQHFMQNFRYDSKTGIGNILVSPARKPLPLIGGFQASVRFKRVNTKPKYRIKERGMLPSDVKYEKYTPKKLKKSYLYTDRLDLLRGTGFTQKIPHLTIMSDFRTDHISETDKLTTSLKEKNWKRAAQSSARLAGKALKAGGRFFAFKFARI
tara:strand:- start:1047 stop:2486 length:1440 start_codon:yes stop_codon:yes gene_type:complete